jgi:hypothetical protein
MPLPSSGQISIADIRNEAVTGGCYSPSSPYSLGALATAFGIGTNPDAMSEFYTRSCPTYTVNLYRKQGRVPSPLTSAQLYSSIDNINWTYRGPIDSTTCTLYPVGTFTVSSGTTVYIGITNGSDYAYFNAAATSTCPDNTATYCFGEFSQTITTNTNLSITAYVDRFGGTYVPCGGICTVCEL